MYHVYADLGFGPLKLVASCLDQDAAEAVLRLYGPREATSLGPSSSAYPEVPRDLLTGW